MKKQSVESTFETEVRDATKALLKAIQKAGGIKENDPNFADTPDRVGRAYVEIMGGLFDNDRLVKEILSRQFPSKAKEMVVVGPVHVWSLCPHHLLPVEMNAWVGYLPDLKVLGLSKLARLAEIVAKKPGLQEDTTSEIADHLYMGLRSKGSGCLIRGRHLCMAMRGVKQGTAITMTTQLRGDFLRPEVRSEFLQAVRSELSLEG